MKKISILFISLLVLCACSKDDDNNTGGDAKSDAKEITAFTFLASENEALDEDVKATIDNEKKTIAATVPTGTDMTALKPTLTISEKATVNPKDKDEVDFNDKVEFTVTAEDGSTQKYVVTINTIEITSFGFLATDNEALGKDFQAEVDEDSRQISIKLPFGTSLKSLAPTIVFTENATINPKNKVAQDFNDGMEYTVTAADGSTALYVVNITFLVKKEDRDILIAFYSANEGNRLGWNLDAEDITVWKGVTLNPDGRVLGIAFSSDKGIVDLPPQMGGLDSLERLDLRLNQLTALPNELGNLKNLRRLYLQSNNITNYPSAISGMTGLTQLSLFDNGMSTLPSSIGNLTNLEELTLAKNAFTTLPSTIGNLKNLRKLVIDRNPSLTSLPTEMVSLASLKELFIDKDKENLITQELRDFFNSNSVRIVLVEPEQD
ncbi:MAG: DUF5018 domain-containing protein [Bacteroidota bacterium]